MEIKNNIISMFTLLTLLFCGVNSVFSQEWEFTFSSNDITIRDRYEEAIEMSNGNVLVVSRLQHMNNNGKFSATQPSLTLISSDGCQISKKDYIKPAYCEINSPYLFEKNGELYMLGNYNPDHDPNSDNYFKNYDNPPADAIIGLYKLDDLLNVTKSYEHSFPIDTFEQRDMYWQAYPSIFSGNIFIYSAVEDEGNIVGSYIKSVSWADVPRGHDTIFFFRMDFDGNFLVRKAYELHTNGGEHQTQYYRQQIVKNDDEYIVYYRGYSTIHHGTIEYYDNDFNLITTKYFDSPGHSPYEENNFCNHTVIRSDHNTTYLATTSLMPLADCPDDSFFQNRNIRLYEIDDDKDNSTEVLPIVKYFERESSDLDNLPYRSLDMTSDGYIYFAYTLNYGSMGSGDSWIMIEKLDSDFDTISTFYYDEGIDVHTEASCIYTTKDDGLILVSFLYDVYDRTDRWSKVTKFPASAFDPDNIGEAHAHNLHLAVAYPNPGGDVLNIRTGLRDAILTVYDLQGRKIHEQEITDDFTSVDASNWQSGTYIWELKTENGKLKIEEGKWVK